MSVVAFDREENARRLARVIEDIIEVENLLLARGFLRVRVMVNTNNPLIAGVWLPRSNDRDTWIEFRYEKLQDFCYSYGQIGHGILECSFRLIGGKEARYGD